MQQKLNNFITEYYFNELRIQSYQTLLSTQKTAIEFLRTTTIQPPFAINCKKQMEGIGRGNNNWLDFTGSLKISYVLNYTINQNIFPLLLSFEIIKILQNRFPSLHNLLKIKWPNDIYFKEKKISGTRIDLINYNNKIYPIIGIGLNCACIPKQYNNNITSIEDIIGKNKFCLSQLLKTLQEEIFTSIIKINNNNMSYTNLLIKNWRTIAFGIGKKCYITCNGKKNYGVYNNIKQDGAIIIIDKNNKQHSFISGSLVITES